MAEISGYERAVLTATAAFLLFTGGWFARDQQTAIPYEVTTVRSGVEDVLPSDSTESDTQTDGQPQEDAPDSLLEGEKIDLNTADVSDLQRLPGIGATRAQAIVADREENGPFQSVEEVTRVSGIGDGILAQIQDYATVS
jgi:competence protein ComEA